MYKLIKFTYYNIALGIVICPRSPYCSSDPNTNGKFKVMWWWDNINMQDHAIIEAY